MLTPVSVQSPLGTLLGWLDALARDVHDDVVFLAHELLPGRCEQAHSSHCAAEHTECVRARCSDASARPVSHAGMAIALAAVLDFVVVGRSSQADWERTKALTERLLADARAEGQLEIAETLERQSESLEFRSKQWLRACKQWSELRETALSQTAISEWLRAALAENPRYLHK